MNDANTPLLPAGELDALEARFALKITSGLNEASATLPHDLAERLRVARELALERARQARKLAAAPAIVSGASAGVVALGGGSPSWWWRLATILPFVALVAGLLLVQQFQAEEEIDAAAEIDAALLADDLPPDAYSDPGFREYLSVPGPFTPRSE